MCAHVYVRTCVFQVKEAKVTEAKINEAREHYRPAAARASLLYFIMNDLNKIHPMYQFALKVSLASDPDLHVHSLQAHVSATVFPPPHSLASFSG